jgi:hypothetical protein
MNPADATANATVAVQGLGLVQLDVFSGLGRQSWGMISVDKDCSREGFHRSWVPRGPCWGVEDGRYRTRRDRSCTDGPGIQQPLDRDPHPIPG